MTKYKFQPSSSQGFTLIELMIVIVIVAIITSIAVPSYQDQMLRTRRTDATEALLSIAALQERYYLQNNVYADVDDNLWNADTAQGFYTISMAENLVCPGTDASELDPPLRCFILQARPAAGSPQSQDTECAVIQIDSAGRRLAFDSEGNQQIAECW